MKVQKSNCVYCGLPAHGKGCRFAPKGIHIHATPNKCMYCGLNLTGPGCRFAPNNIHVKFGDFGFIQSEERIDAGVLGYLLYEIYNVTDELTTSISGQIKKRFKKIIEQNKEIIFEHLLLNTAEHSNKEFDRSLYEKEIEFKEGIDVAIQQIFGLIEEYRDVLSEDLIDKLIIERFLRKK